MTWVQKLLRKLKAKMKQEWETIRISKPQSKLQKPESINSAGRRGILNIHVVQSGKGWDLGSADSAGSARNRWCPKEVTSQDTTDQHPSSCRILGRNLPGCDAVSARPGLSYVLGDFLQWTWPKSLRLKRQWNIPNTATRTSGARLGADSQY